MHTCVRACVCVCVCVQSLKRVRLSATLWTVACPAPLSMGFSKQGYWSGLPFPSPGHLSSCTAGRFLEPPGKPPRQARFRPVQAEESVTFSAESATVALSCWPIPSSRKGGGHPAGFGAHRLEKTRFAVERCAASESHLSFPSSRK